ncbi:TRAP transporter large permease subunit [Roseovarius aestuarii]|nr:TRAP transporter large permease subunit [Roseovarius aestuarii]
MAANVPTDEAGPAHPVGPQRDAFSFVDTISRFTGIAVAQLYLVAVFATIWEVFARYVMNAPTSWAFELVMVCSATAWIMSGGYIALYKRHIGITVIYTMVGDRAKWWLDFIALSTGVLALTLFLDDNVVRALHSIGLVERTGSAFNSPEPMVLKTVLSLGSFLYLMQLLVLLWRHFTSGVGRGIVLAIAGLILLKLSLTVLEYFGVESSLIQLVHGVFKSTGEMVNPQDWVDARSIDKGLITIIMAASLFGLMLVGMPLAVVTLTVSIGMTLVFFGPNGLYLVSTNAFGLLENYALVAVPLFVMMASILERAGIARDLFDAMSIFAGNLRGGVAVQTTVVAVILAAMSGVMGGEIVMLGMVALPQMLRLGYDSKLAVGIICASGSLATLIPPSIVMIVFGLSANVGIGDLFLGGFVPGLMLASFYAIYVLVWCNLNPKLAPTAQEVAAITGQDNALTKSQKRAVAMCIALIFCVMGSIYAGIASVTEAAGVGAVGAMAVAFVRGKLSMNMIQGALVGTMSVVGTIIWLIVGASAFVGIYNLIGGGAYMRDLFANLGMSPLMIIFLMMGILVIMGTFMDWIAIIFLTVPIFAPVVRDLAPALGMEPDDAALWFGILFVVNIQIYFLSPPFGPACFWLKSVAPPEITLQQIFLGVLPFIGLQVLGLILIIVFPEIALWLPRVLG